MPTAAEIAASKEAQLQEGVNRQPFTDSGDREADPHQTPLSDATGNEPDGGAGPLGDDDGGQQDRQERTKPIYMSPSDEARANIAKRYKRDDEGRVPFNGDPNDPEMLYGKFGREDEPEPKPKPEPEPQPRQEHQPQPRMITMKVRGQDVTKSEAEWLADAAKVTAADSYLEEGRQLLENARQIKRDNRERDPADPHRPEDRANTQDDGTNLDPDGNPQHPGDELEAAIDEVRYGADSKEAAQKLRKVIGSEADKAADQRQIQRLLGQDNAKSAKAMKAFIDANPDLANDERASRLMAGEIFDLQREELIKAGIDVSKLPKDNATLANWHQFQRIHGSAVSSQEQLLDAAKQRLQSWRGGTPKQQQTEQRRNEKPRIEVNVDRNARRASLPNQPTRSGAPPVQRQQTESAQPRDRSSVIANMRKGRGQIVA